MEKIDLNQILAIKLLGISKDDLSDTQNKIFNFETLKEAACHLYDSFYEDIITLEEKVRFTEFAFSKETLESGKIDPFFYKLKDTVSTRLLQAFRDMELSSIQTPRHKVLSNTDGLQSLHTSPSFDANSIKRYIKEGLQSRMASLNNSTLLDSEGPHDGEFIRSSSRLIDIMKYFDISGSSNDFADKLEFNTHSIIELLTSPSNQENSSLESFDPSMLIELDITQLQKEIFEKQRSWQLDISNPSKTKILRQRMVRQLNEIAVKSLIVDTDFDIDEIALQKIRKDGSLYSSNILGRLLKKQFDSFKLTLDMNNDFIYLQRKIREAELRILEIQSNFNSLSNGCLSKSTFPIMGNSDDLTALETAMRGSTYKSPQEIVAELVTNSGPEQSLYTDLWVSKVYNEVVSGILNLDVIKSLKKNSWSTEKMINLEKLVQSVLGLLSSLKEVFEDLENIKLAEKALFSNMVSKVIDNLDLENNSKISIYTIIDQLFSKIDRVVELKTSHAIKTNPDMLIEPQNRFASSAALESTRSNLSLTVRDLSLQSGVVIQKLVVDQNSKTIFDGGMLNRILRSNFKALSSTKNEGFNTPRDTLFMYYMNELPLDGPPFFKIYYTHFDVSGKVNIRSFYYLSHPSNNNIRRDESAAIDGSFSKEFKFSMADLKNSNFVITPQILETPISFEHKIENNLKLYSKLVLSLFHLGNDQMMSASCLINQNSQTSDFLVPDSSIEDILASVQQRNSIFARSSRNPQTLENDGFLVTQKLNGDNSFMSSNIQTENHNNMATHPTTTVTRHGKSSSNGFMESLRSQIDYNGPDLAKGIREAFEHIEEKMGGSRRVNQLESNVTDQVEQQVQMANDSFMRRRDEQGMEWSNLRKEDEKKRAAEEEDKIKVHQEYEKSKKIKEEVQRVEKMRKQREEESKKKRDEAFNLSQRKEQQRLDRLKQDRLDRSEIEKSQREEDIQKALQEVAESHRKPDTQTLSGQRDLLKKEKADNKRREREEEMKKVEEERRFREEKNRKEREERQKLERERREDERQRREKRELERKEREAREAEDKRLLEEQRQIERQQKQEREKIEREEQQKQRREKEQRDKEERERLQRDREEEERRQRERREFEKKQRLEDERLERERKEQERQLEKERQEEERRIAKLKREREDEERKLKAQKIKFEREEREREERQQRDEEERLEKEKKRKQEQEQREREDRELEARNKREEADRLEREQREREQRERKEREEKEKEEREHKEREERERIEREDRERQQRERIEAEAREQRDRIEREAREQRDRIEREAREQREHDEQEARELREKEERDARELREKEEREFQAMLQKEKEEKERQEREHKEQQEQERIRLQKEQEEKDAQEQRLKKQQEEEEEEERLQKQQQEEQEAERLRLQKQKEQEEQEAADTAAEKLKKEQEKEKEDEDILGDLDDFDDFGDDPNEDNDDDWGSQGDDFLEDLKKSDKKNGSKKEIKEADLFDDFDDEIAINTYKDEQDPAQKNEEDDEINFDDEDDDFEDDFTPSQPVPKKNEDIDFDEIEDEDFNLDQAAQKKKEEQKKDEYDFDDDDFDDILGSGEIPDIEDVKVADKPPTTKKDDDDLFDDFDDDFDDGFDDIPDDQEAEVKKSKEDNKGDDDFDDFGLDNLDDDDDNWDQNEESPVKPEVEAPMENGEVVEDSETSESQNCIFTRSDLPLIQMIQDQVFPQSEDEVQAYLSEQQFENLQISLLLQQFMKTESCCALDYEDSIKINDCLSKLGDDPDDEALFREAKVCGSEMNQVMIETFQKQDFKTSMNLLIPFLPDENSIDNIVLMVVSVAKGKVLLVSLNPDLDQRTMNLDKKINTLVKFSYFCSVYALNPSADSSSIQFDNKDHSRILAPSMGEGIIGFLTESCEDPYLRFYVLCYLMYFENLQPKFEIENLVRNLELEDFDFDHATRLVITSKLLGFDEQILNMAEIINNLGSQYNQMEECHIVPVMNETEQSPEEFKTLIDQGFESMGQLLEMKQIVFVGVSFMMEDQTQFTCLVVLTKEAAQVIELLPTSESIRQPVLDHLKSLISGLGVQEVIELKDYPKTMVAFEDITIMMTTIAHLMVSMNLELENILKMLIYNDLPYKLLLDSMMEEGEGEGQEGQEFPAEQDQVAGGEGAEGLGVDYDDLGDDDFEFDDGDFDDGLQVGDGEKAVIADGGDEDFDDFDDFDDGDFDDL